MNFAITPAMKPMMIVQIMPMRVSSPQRAGLPRRSLVTLAGRIKALFDENPRQRGHADGDLLSNRTCGERLRER
jgi:hypothetical protein